MLTRHYTKQFKKSSKHIIKSGIVSQRLLENIIDQLAEQKPLEKRYCDHQLTGVWNGYRECHLKPDLLLIYKIEKQALILILADIGSHSQLFD